MRRGAWARIALWLAGIGACLAVISQARFVADLSSFLPQAPTERHTARYQPGQPAQRLKPIRGGVGHRRRTCHSLAFI